GPSRPATACAAGPSPAPYGARRPPLTSPAPRRWPCVLVHTPAGRLFPRRPPGSPATPPHTAPLTPATGHSWRTSYEACHQHQGVIRVPAESGQDVVGDLLRRVPQE